MTLVSRATSSNDAVCSTSPVLCHVTLPPGATDNCGGLKAKSTMSTDAVGGAADGGAGPARSVPVTVSVPFITCGWISQWKVYVPGLGTVTVALLPAKRPPSAPGATTPVSKEPSSAVIVCGLPPTFANWIVEPASAVSVFGTNRRVSAGSAGSTASTRLVAAGWTPGVTTMTPFIFEGLMRQK